MAKFAREANRHLIWVWGKCYEFFRVTSNGSQSNLTEARMLNQPNPGAPAEANDYKGSLTNPTTAQKNQIVLHCTASNSSAQGTVNWWNDSRSGIGGAQYILERASSAQADRPAMQAGSDSQDTGLVDAVLAMPEESIPYHAGVVNQSSIGIELVNVGWGFHLTNTTNEPHLNIPHEPASTCPDRINEAKPGDPPVWKCSHMGSHDENRYIHLENPLDMFSNYQAYEDKQYKTLVLLLRHLCIAHRIPRKFLGKSTDDAFRHFYWSTSGFDGQSGNRRMMGSSIFHFRGILHHRNVHASKQCPGVVHRNRLFRGIIDEWWLPVQLDGAPRNYYSGPFEMPEFQTGQPTRPAFFRWRRFNGDQPQAEGVAYSGCELDAIMETQSYFNLKATSQYFSFCETRNGGFFPIGMNKVWHGGIHLAPNARNPAVYAAASGAIVAARLSGNDATDNETNFGSQRFILIRHYVYVNTENDPEGKGQRINYTGEPFRVFSLYMHLNPIADIERENNQNPPWFNLWRRHNPDTDIGLNREKGVVFNPNIEVSVGDILGVAGNYAGQDHCLHFEIMSHRNNELAMNPWDNNDLRVDDSDDEDVICDVDALDNFVIDTHGDGIDIIDVLRAAPSLRNVKSLHKSEWSLQSADALSPVVDDADKRSSLWEHINRLTWWEEAIKANPDLEEQLGADGIVWHYHPITFMSYINKLNLSETYEISENEYALTNIELDENYFLRGFVRRENGNWVDENADNSYIYPYQVSRNVFKYHFTRADLACAACRAGGDSPAGTQFSLALLDALEFIRGHSNIPMAVELSYVCDTHSNQSNLCCLNSNESLAKHNAGIAIDFRPSSLSANNCRKLFASTSNFVKTAFHTDPTKRGGNIYQDCLPEEYSNILWTVHPQSAHNKLVENANATLDNDEISHFRIHMELVESLDIAGVQADTTPLNVKLMVSFKEIHILDDMDASGRGEWNLDVRVNGEVWGSIDQKVSTGQIIQLTDAQWTRDIEVNANDGEELVIEISGKEDDLLSAQDDLGVANVAFNSNSAPAWGKGTQTIISPKETYKTLLEIDVQTTDVETI